MLIIKKSVNYQLYIIVIGLIEILIDISLYLSIQTNKES